MKKHNRMNSSNTLDKNCGPNAASGEAYTNTIAGDVTDTNVGEALTFAKLSGPAWLAVAADGSLSGVPAGGDVGTNAFAVCVTDPTGFTDDATVRIAVLNLAPPKPTGAIAGANLNISWPADQLGWRLLAITSSAKADYLILNLDGGWLAR